MKIKKRTVSVIHTIEPPTTVFVYFPLEEMSNGWHSECLWDHIKVWSCDLWVYRIPLIISSGNQNMPLSSSNVKQASVVGHCLLLPFSWNSSASEAKNWNHQKTVQFLSLRLANPTLCPSSSPRTFCPSSSYFDMNIFCILLKISQGLHTVFQHGKWKKATSGQ